MSYWPSDTRSRKRTPRKSAALPALERGTTVRFKHGSRPTFTVQRIKMRREQRQVGKK